MNKSYEYILWRAGGALSSIGCSQQKWSRATNPSIDHGVVLLTCKHAHQSSSKQLIYGRGVCGCGQEIDVLTCDMIWYYNVHINCFSMMGLTQTGKFPIPCRNTYILGDVFPRRSAFLLPPKGNKCFKKCSLSEEHKIRCDVWEKKVTLDSWVEVECEPSNNFSRERSTGGARSTPILACLQK